MNKNVPSNNQTSFLDINEEILKKYKDTHLQVAVVLQ